MEESLSALLDDREEIAEGDADLGDPFSREATPSGPGGAGRVLTGGGVPCPMPLWSASAPSRG